ncbi:MAG TPA: hypothetical protein VI248_11765 [Kineosporiaceae bacterium]
MQNNRIVPLSQAVMTDQRSVRQTRTALAAARRVGVGLMVALALLVGGTGCGGSRGGSTASPTSAVAGAPTATSAQAVTSGTGAAPAGSPSTGACQKARFALHAGLAAGAVHRYLWKPYQAGTFAAGAPGRRTAMVKAALAGAFAAHELKVAVGDIRGCPSAQRLVTTVEQTMGQAGALVPALRSGTADPATLGTLNGAVSSVESQARSAGIDVKEQEPTPSQLAGGSSGP